MQKRKIGIHSSTICFEFVDILSKSGESIFLIKNIFSKIPLTICYSFKQYFINNKIKTLVLLCNTSKSFKTQFWKSTCNFLKD